MKAIPNKWATEQERDAAANLLTLLGIADEAHEEGRYDEFIGHALVLARMLSILWAKRGYGDSWRETGYLGSVLKISAKTHRLMNVLWHRSAVDGVDDDPQTEDSGDTFLDLANFAVFGFQQWNVGEDRGVARRDR